jgi:hypothetical protein
MKEGPDPRRSTSPPDGYLGHRSELEEGAGTTLGAGGWIAIIVLSLGVTIAVLWFILSLVTWKD